MEDIGVRRTSGNRHPVGPLARRTSGNFRLGLLAYERYSVAQKRCSEKYVER